jgi:hypothetical protein
MVARVPANALNNVCSVEVKRHQLQWNVAGRVGGVYLYRLMANGFLETGKLIRLSDKKISSEVAMRTKLHFALLNSVFVFISAFLIHTQLSQGQQRGIVVYSNSFESLQDTVGWRGSMQFRNDAAPDCGNQSLFISGGCVWPHAWIELGPYDNNGYYIIRCWGKDLQIGGSISIEVDGDFPRDQIGIAVNDKEWTHYESDRTLYCPAGRRIVLSMGAGGIVPSAMLVDKLEIVNVQSSNAQWLMRNSGTMEKLNDVAVLDSSTAIVVGSGGSILKTTDSGETWKNTAPLLDCAPGTYCIMRWNGVSFYDKLNGIVVGDNVVMTTDGGEEWHFLDLPAQDKSLCIGKLGLDNIYIGDDSGYVYNSRDTGKTWSSERITTLPIRSIFPVRGLDTHNLEIFALTPHSLFIRTEYPSTPWREWGTLGYFQGLGSEAFKGDFSEDGTAFIVGVEGDWVALSTIIRLRPPDSHWYSVGPGEIGELRGLSIPTSKVVYTCGSSGKILKSTNGGDDWIFLKTPTSQTLNSIHFLDNERGFAVGDSGTILYTSNGGVSSTNHPPSSFRLLRPANEDSVPVMRSITFVWQKAIDPNNDPVRYTLLISSDTGVTWKSYGPTADTTLQVHSPAQTPGRYFWTVIANDGMLATPSLEVFAFTIISVSDVDGNSNKMPGEFVLLQNYPNPFNPSTTISFDLPTRSQVTLKILNVLGQEVATLVDGEVQAGRHEVLWNAAQNPSGVYFYRLTAYGAEHTQRSVYTQTRKLIVVR